MFSFIDKSIVVDDANAHLTVEMIHGCLSIEMQGTTPAPLRPSVANTNPAKHFNGIIRAYLIRIHAVVLHNNERKWTAWIVPLTTVRIETFCFVHTGLEDAIDLG